MLKFVLGGIWICLVTAVSVYTASSWSAGASAPEDDQPYIKGLDYQKTRLMTVPVIRDGQMTGYVLGRFVFTAEAETLRDLPVPAEIFVVDEAFRALYAEDQVDFEHLERYDLTELTQSITDSVNARMKMELVHETLIDQLNYFPMSEVAKQLNKPPIMQSGAESGDEGDGDDGAQGGDEGGH